MIGSSGRLYLPSSSASGEGKRVTCGQEFRIKGGSILLNQETAQGYVPVDSLPLLE